MYKSIGWLGGIALFATLAAVPPPCAAESREAALEAVRHAELAFAGAVAANDPARFASMIDADAVFVGARVTRGKAAIVEDWKVFFGEGRPDFTWRPEIVELSGDGTVGMTRGPWTMKSKATDGQLVERSGIFNSIWKRQPDGSWRVIFDLGCPVCPACGAGGG